MKAADILAAIEAATHKANRTLTFQVRKEASQRGWPANVARDLTVDLTADEPIEMSDEAKEWEYGNMSRPPMPVVRPFIEKSVTVAFISTVRNEMSSRGVVI